MNKLRKLFEDVREARDNHMNLPIGTLADRAVCLAGYFLAHPEAIEAVEALQIWGNAIKEADAASEAVPEDADPTSEQQAKYDEAYWRAVAAKDRVRKIADKLAAKEGK